MPKIFNRSNRLFQLESGADRMLVAPRKLLDLDTRFTADITFRAAVAAGDIELISGAQKLDTQEAEKQAGTELKETEIRHPDGLEEKEAARREAAATGKIVRKKTEKD